MTNYDVGLKRHPTGGFFMDWDFVKNAPIGSLPDLNQRLAEFGEVALSADRMLQDALQVTLAKARAEAARMFGLNTLSAQNYLAREAELAFLRASPTNRRNQQQQDQNIFELTEIAPEVEAPVQSLQSDLQQVHGLPRDLPDTDRKPKISIALPQNVKGRKAKHSRRLQFILSGIAGAIGIVTLMPHNGGKFDQHPTENLSQTEADIARENAKIKLVPETVVAEQLGVFDNFYYVQGQQKLIQETKNKTKALADIDKALSKAKAAERQALQVKRDSAAAELKALPKIKINDMATVSNGFAIAALMVPQKDFEGPLKDQGPAERFAILNTIALPESQYRSNAVAMNNYNGDITARGSLEMQMPELLVMMMRHHNRLTSPHGKDPFKVYIKATQAIADQYAKANFGEMRKAKGIAAVRQLIADRSDLARKAWKSADEDDKVVLRRALIDQTPVTIFGIRSNVGSVLSGFTTQYLSDENCNMPQNLVAEYGLASLIYAKHNQGAGVFSVMLRDIAELRDPSLFRARMEEEVRVARKAAMPIINAITNQTLIANGATARIGKANGTIKQANKLAEQAKRLKKQKKISKTAAAKANAILARMNANIAKANDAIAKERKVLAAANAALVAAHAKDAKNKLTETYNRKQQWLRQGITAQWPRDIASIAPTNKILYYYNGKLRGPEEFLAQVRDTYGIVTQPSLIMGQAFAPYYKQEGGVRQIVGHPIPQIRREGRRLTLLVAPLALEASLKAEARRKAEAARKAAAAKTMKASPIRPQTMRISFVSNVRTVS